MDLSHGGDMKLSIILLLVSTHLYAKTYFPDCKNGELIKHRYYSLCYSEDHEQASWTAHRLTIKSITGPQKRTNNFRIDRDVVTGSATKEDYKHSGFDRGHLVPAGDMKLNRTSMSETFYMSNMSPQVAGFNRGVWNRIENIVRKWTKTYDELFVVTGPVLEKGLPVIGYGVSIPKYFYKIVFDNTSKTPKMLAFLIENKSDKKHISEFVTTVDEVERVTGLNFFASLPTKLQAKLESSSNFKDWKTSKR